MAEHCVSSRSCWEQRKVLAYTAQAQSGTDQGDWELVVDLSHNLMLLFLQISYTLLIQKCCSDEFFIMYLISLVKVNQAVKWLSRMIVTLKS